MNYSNIETRIKKLIEENYIVKDELKDEEIDCLTNSDVNLLYFF